MFPALVSTTYCVDFIHHSLALIQGQILKARPNTQQLQSLTTGMDTMRCYYFFWCFLLSICVLLMSLALLINITMKCAAIGSQSIELYCVILWLFQVDVGW